MPLSIRSISPSKAGWKRNTWPVMATTPAARAAATMASPSAISSAMGFSTRRCLPAAIAASAFSAWNWGGSASTTPSMSGSARTSAGVRATVPVSSAIAAARSGLRSATATSAPRSRSVRAWLAPQYPAPMTAMAGTSRSVMVLRLSLLAAGIVIQPLKRKSALEYRICRGHPPAHGTFPGPKLFNRCRLTLKTATPYMPPTPATQRLIRTKTCRTGPGGVAQ
ncbi:hypothetical protein RHIZ404_200985 [Rhizobium sp. EC-SD404]|nr:hypothetical protein RHIZ404_200985 [Rhizobium sp. EC-SD404]